MRFHLDENVSVAIAHGLRLRDIDVSTSLDAGLQGAEDSAQVAHAIAEGRVIFTHDSDFLRQHQAGVRHAGIVYSKQGTRTAGEVVRFLKLMHDCLNEADMAGRLEFF